MQIKSYVINKKKGHAYYQWLIAIVVNLTTLNNGTECGWISPTSKIFKSTSSPAGEPLSDTMIGWIAGSMNLSACFAMPLIGFISDKYGRKACILFIGIPRVISWVIRATFTSTISLIIARCLSGIAAGGTFCIAMYVKEISQDDIRGSLGCLLVMAQNIGILAMYIMGSYLDYYTVVYIMIGMPILSALPMMKAPETTEFLVKQGKIEEAEKTMAFLRGLDKNNEIVRNEIEAIKTKDTLYKSLPKMSLKTLLTDKYGRKILMFMFLLYTFQQYNGAFVMIIYAVPILESTEAYFGISLEMQSFGLPIMMIIGSLTLTVLIEKIGRKRILVTAFLVSGIASAVLGSAMLVKNRGGITPSWLPIFVLTIVVMMYGGAIFPLPHIYMNEMVNFKMRATVMTFTTAYVWFITFLVTSTYPMITNAFGQYTAFYFYAIINIFGAIFVFIFLPETKGKSEEDIYVEIMGKNKENF